VIKDISSNNNKNIIINNNNYHVIFACGHDTVMTEEQLHNPMIELLDVSRQQKADAYFCEDWNARKNKEPT
jgi:hypothetical protein